MKKFLILLCMSHAFALSLGDVVNDAAVQAQTTTTTTMKLTKQTSNHSEYRIAKSTGNITALVNNNHQIYAFTWDDKNPNLSSMLGSYKAEFDQAYNNRPNKFNHRALVIDTPNLSVRQFGLPGSNMQGSIYAKNLEPNSHTTTE